MSDFLSRINIYGMTNKELTKEQYLTLKEMDYEFHTLITADYCRNLDQGWLKKMQSIYKEVFSMPISVTCKACIMDAMKKLYKKIQAYESTNNGCDTGSSNGDQPTSPNKRTNHKGKSTRPS